MNLNDNLFSEAYPLNTPSYADFEWKDFMMNLLPPSPSPIFFDQPWTSSDEEDGLFMASTTNSLPPLSANFLTSLHVVENVVDLGPPMLMDYGSSSSTVQAASPAPAGIERIDTEEACSSGAPCDSGRLPTGKKLYECTEEDYQLRKVGKETKTDFLRRVRKAERNHLGREAKKVWCYCCLPRQQKYPEVMALIKKYATLKLARAKKGCIQQFLEEHKDKYSTLVPGTDL